MFFGLLSHSFGGILPLCLLHDTNMTNFAYTSSEIYQDSYYPDEPQGGGLKRFKSELREWLKAERLNFKWLAVNLGRSEGTVKNWLYSSLPISAAMMDKILEVCLAHLQGGGDIKYPNRHEEAAIAYVTLHLVDPARPELWCMAAGVPADSLESRKGAYYADLAEWITDSVMEATRSVLRDAKESGKLDLSVRLKNECIPQGSEYHGGYDRDDYTMTIPILFRKWHSGFLQMAANLQGDSAEVWIMRCLNDAAMKQSEADLAAFLDEAPDDSYRKKVIPPPASDDDDIPF